MLGVKTIAFVFMTVMKLTLVVMELVMMLAMTMDGDYYAAVNDDDDNIEEMHFYKFRSHT